MNPPQSSATTRAPRRRFLRELNELPRHQSPQTSAYSRNTSFNDFWKKKNDDLKLVSLSLLTSAVPRRRLPSIETNTTIPKEKNAFARFFPFSPFPPPDCECVCVCVCVCAFWKCRLIFIQRVLIEDLRCLGL